MTQDKIEISQLKNIYSLSYPLDGKGYLKVTFFQCFPEIRGKQSRKVTLSLFKKLVT